VQDDRVAPGVAAQQGGAAGVGAQQPEQDAQGGGLAGLWRCAGRSRRSHATLLSRTCEWRIRAASAWRRHASAAGRRGGGPGSGDRA
jgi:hypothetical protein